jgi:zinc transport system permease protein
MAVDRAFALYFMLRFYLCSNGVSPHLQDASCVLTAATIVMAMRVVGVLLIAALMVLPVAISRIYAKSFRTTMIAAAAIGGVSALVGLAIARLAGLAAGGTIVLLVTVVFLLASVGSALRRPSAPKPEHDHVH